MPAKASTLDNYFNRTLSQDSARTILMSEASRAVLALFDHMEVCRDAAAAQASQFEAKREKLRGELEDVETRRGHTVREYQRSGAPMPEGLLEKLDATIKSLKDQLRVSVPDNKIHYGNFAELIEYVQKKRSFIVADDLPVIDDFDVNDDTFADACGATKANRKLLGKTEFASRTPPEIRVQVIDRLDALEKEGAPNLDDIARPNDINDRSGKFQIFRGFNDIGWPRQFFRGGEDTTPFNALAFEVWKDRATIEAKLMAMIDKMPDGISAEDKVKKVGEIHELIATSLRREHAILVALEKRGNYALRQQNYHPSVLLGLAAPAHVIAEYGA